MNYLDRNNSRIKEGFARSFGNVMNIVQPGLVKILKDGMDICLEIHDSKHQRHIESGDSYGYILLYNGIVVAKEIYSGKGVNWANATDALLKVKDSLPQNGWAGAVVAGMNPAGYFNYTYELSVIYDAVEDISTMNFNNYFKPITQ